MFVDGGGTFPNAQLDSGRYYVVCIGKRSGRKLPMTKYFLFLVEGG
jgi:hypothetical protein